ncbi:uncharacterized protein BJX67DRAFT_310853 [Aspergillus lucknowensis]|uniref:Ankyrin repeat protein n=1 Tax=Aspergillus lucknowensis TaxID=176173 RepID=A0ABR4LCI0_9EURO
MSDTEDEWDDETTLLFRTIMQQADEHNLDIEAQSAAFVKNYGSDFTKRNGREDSILHYMAKRPMQENSGQHRLLKFLLEKHNGSDLLKPNDDNQTPLHLGLKRGISNRTNPVFVDTVLALVPSRTLQNVLQECDSSMRSNCLHYAIKNQSPSAMSLIPRCPASLFTQQNVKGETPLHLAMELTIRQNRVPQRVPDSNPIPRMEQDAGKWRVEGDDSILPAKDGLTTKFSEVQRQGGMRPPSPHGKNLQNHKNGAQFIANSARNMHLSKNTAVGPGSVASVATPKPTPSQTHPNSFYLPDVVESLLRDPLVARDTLILKTYAHPNQQGGTVGPYQSRINHVTKQALKSQQSKQQSGDSQSVRKAVEQDPIVRFIKDYCLRNLEREDVIRILYEKDEGRHIEFDLSGLPDPAMPASYLEQLSKHLRFEDCLQYVALPELRMQQRDVYINTLSPEKDQSTLAVLQSQCTGLTDAVVIFDWLRKRDVKKIIRVIVMDSGEVPHTDEAIVESLKDFEVEVWDWRKFDICSETIQLAAKDVRVLHLYSSGINAVLRGWSSEVGLVLLGKVRPFFPR